MDHSHEARGRRIAHFMWEEIEKIAAMPPGAPQAAPPPGAPPPQAAPPVDTPPPEEEPPPSHGVVGVDVKKLEKNKAHGYPVIQPPPGFVFRPDLAAFVPDESQPGWMTPEEEAVGENNKGYYDQGAQDQVTQQAQQKLDENVEQDAAKVQQEQMAAEQMAAQDQALQAKAELSAKKTEARKALLGPDSMPRTGDEAGAAPLTPPGIAGGALPTKPKPSKKPKPKGMVINIGK